MIHLANLGERDDFKLPKLKSYEKVKDGIVKNRQRYKCKNCNFRYTTQDKSAEKNFLKRSALELYLEGLSFRSIGRILKVSHVAVYNWIKSFGEKVEALRTQEAPKVVELDELHTYIGSKKNYCWTWLAVDRFRKKFVDIKFGCRGIKTGQKLYESIDSPKIGMVFTDYWKAYEAFVPRGIHVQSKAETYTVGGYNSIFRHFLARLRRKSKCYSKSIKMLRYSLLLLIEKWNNRLSILD